MSLINQMLKDLEQRGGFPSDTKFEPSNSKSLAKHSEKKAGNTFLKISGALLLLYCAAYIWVKNPGIFKAPQASGTSTASTAHPDMPAPTPILAAPNVTASIVTTPITPVVPIPAVNNLAEQTQSTHSDLQEPSKKISQSAEIKNKKLDTAQIVPKKTAQPDITTAPLNIEPLEIKPLTIEPLAYAAPTVKKSKPILRTVNSENADGVFKQENPTQKSANAYRLALLDIQKGRTNEAQEDLQKAIQDNPANEEARQTLAALLVDNKKLLEAKEVLVEGLKLNPQQPDFRMAVARLELETGDKQSALNTLLQGLNGAKNNAEYQRFLALLLQRADRHEEAIEHYKTAIQLQTTNPNTFIGLGISLQTMAQFEEAEAAYTRALSDEKLSPELTLFVEQRLKQVNQRLTAR